MKTRELFLSFFYVGKFPFASGTVGSLAAIPFGVMVLYFFSQTTLFLLSLLIFAIAIKQIDKYEEETKEHDSSEIVIDEVAGMWLALSFCALDVWQIACAFVFFRVFDVWKPSIIGKVDKNVAGGLGVMGDDMLAGFFAGLSCAIVFGVIERFF